MAHIPVALTGSQSTLKSELASQTSPVVKRAPLVIRAVHLELSIRKIILNSVHGSGGFLSQTFQKKPMAGPAGCF